MFRGIIIVIFAGIMIIGVNGVSFAKMRGEAKENHSKIAQTDTAAHEHTHAPEAQSAAVKEAVDAGNKVCPVGGEKIEEAMKAAYEYEGKIYNFCCAMCIDEFKNDPQKYIKKIEEEIQKEQK